MAVHIPPNPDDPLRLAGCKCPGCDYDLKGATTCQCPECGKLFSPKQLRYGGNTKGNYSLVGPIIAGLIGIGLIIMSTGLFRTMGGGLMGMFLVGIGIVIIALPLLRKLLG